MKDLVWYCSYGSNLSYERFKLYLFGGASPLVDRAYPGCQDKAKPIKDIFYEIPYEMYFAKKAKFWENKAVAFINDKKNNESKTFSRMYLIKKTQFDEIVQQENSPFQTSHHISIDIEELKRTGYLLLGSDEENRFYGKVLLVGSFEDAPIVTFTSKWSMDDISFNEPGIRYLKTIIGGIREKRKIKKEELLNHFININGIKGNYSYKTLSKIIDEIIFNEPIPVEVKGTGKIKRRGEFFVQLNSNVFKDGKKPKYALIKREDRLCEIQARIEYLNDKDIGKEVINMDQQLRVALSAPKGDKVLISPIHKKDAKFVKNSDNLWRRIINSLFGIQINMVRVRRAAYNDMEINVCRLRRESMDIIGIDPGDVVVIESPYNRIKLNALEITQKIKEELDEKLKPSNIADINCEEFLSSYRIENNKVDINELLIDFDVRNYLKIGQCAPVRIRRSILFEIRKRLHYLSTPLILTILAALAPFPSLSDTTKITFLAFGIIIIFILSFINIRMKV